jgi:hypothetical protein
MRPNVTSVAARVAEQPETIETSWDGKETCLSIEAEPFTNIYEGAPAACVWAILEGKNIMAAMYPPTGSTF